MKRPPTVSTPRVNGVTSINKMSLFSVKAEAWMAAPTATASSGWTLVFGFLLKNSFNNSRILGILVLPPTRTMSSISSISRLTSYRALSTGYSDFLKRSALSSSNLALDSELDQSSPFIKFSIVNSVLVIVDRRRLAFSTSLFNNDFYFL